ncbi:flagellar biosynthesis protein FliO [Rhizobium vallis]|uniref:Flagellar biosynthesis protein FliO n=1 Tax=Rhizobium vallis TaxID=634290 RepID=A0A3S0SC99_9HYPH|nr:flagellar biosynthetic protein FliO [Rhizobium vallis]RUM25576.1 flagellar biosynthesis protein FliO [Rhizobium vallis]
MTMLDDVVGAYGGRFLLAAGGVGLALLLLILVLWVIRNRAPSPFVRGGRNRQPRLQVLDAAAVDTRRRLVLVRRDDVEHLVMIGGPTDIVIESRILPAAAEQPESAFRPQAPEQLSTPAARLDTPLASLPRPPVAARVEPAAEPSFSAPAAQEPRPRPEPLAQPVVAPPVATSPLPAEPVIPPVAASLSAERDIPLRAAPPQPRPPERPAAPPVVQPAPYRDAASAAEILDAARQRVLPQRRIEPEVSAPPVQDMPAAMRTAATADDAAAQSAAIRPDFQQVLEQEMSNNLTAERIVPPTATQAAPANQAPRQATPQPGQPGNLPRRDPDLAPITGADTELQKEVARIFGEMSVNRDK